MSSEHPDLVKVFETAINRNTDSPEVSQGGQRFKWNGTQWSPVADGEQGVDFGVVAPQRLSDDGLKAWLPKTAPAPPALGLPCGATKCKLATEWADIVDRATEAVGSLTTALAAEKRTVSELRASRARLEVDISANRIEANQRILELERQVGEASRWADTIADSAYANGDANKLREEIRALRAQLALAESKRAPARHRPGPQVSVGWDPEGE